MGSTRHTKRAMFVHAFLPICIATYLTLMPFDTPLMVADSFGYMSLSDQHSLTYPLIIKVIEIFSPKADAIIYAQIWLFALAVFYFSLSIKKVLNSHILAQVIALPILFNPFTLNTLYSLLPDAVFFSFSLLMLGFFFSSFRQPHFINLIGFGLCVGLSISIEPYGFAYFPLILIAASLLSKRKHSSFLKNLFLPVVGCSLVLLLETLSYNSLHPDKTRHQITPYLFANAVLMETVQTSPYAKLDPRTIIWNKIENALKDQRVEIWNTNDKTLSDQALITSYKSIRDNFAQDEINTASLILNKSNNEIRHDIAMARVVQDPLSFLNIITRQYQILWKPLDNFALPLMIFSGSVMLIGLFFWITGKAFNAMFACAFLSASIVQGITIWIAYTGLGSNQILLTLTPFLSLTGLGIVLGFYTVFINPVRIND